MKDPHTEPNSAFSSFIAEDDPWIELFHSRPSWKVSQISFSKDGGYTWVPFGTCKLIEAAEIRKGFRVFRIRAKQLQFVLADSTVSVKDSNHGRNYTIDSPGRYVVESGNGCRRVSDAQIADCLRALRPNDTFVEVTFHCVQDWRNCFITYAFYKDKESEWFKLPMNKFAFKQRTWAICLIGKTGIDCAFNDGSEEWDSNNGKNYQIRLPGRYTAGNGFLSYLGIAQLDMHCS